jgi:thioredoxin 1
MLVVKRYTATWCGPCKQLAPIFDQLQSEISEVNFQTIDVDMSRDEALEKGISSVPTVVLEKNGQQVYRFSGVLPKTTIAGLIRQHL